MTNAYAPAWYGKVMGWKRIIAIALSVLLSSCKTAPVNRVGSAGDGFIVTTEQLVRPAGKSLAYAGRPFDLALAPDGKTVYVKSHGSLLAIDRATWTLKQELRYVEKVGGATMHGLLVSRD